jgi:hypothetical protein
LLDAAVLKGDLYPAACRTDATNAVNDLSPGLTGSKEWIERRDWSSDRDRHIVLSSWDGGIIKAYSDVFSIGSVQVSSWADFKGGALTLFLIY